MLALKNYGGIFLLIPLTIQIAQAQLAKMNYFHTLSGKIVDYSTKKNVEFANIAVENTGLTCVSNEYGEFRINIPFDSTSVTLIIGRLGYELKKELVTLPQDNNLKINIKSAIYQLKEVKISAKKHREKARKIVRQAIDSIPQLFYRDTLVYEGYYRDYIKHDSLKYINLYEAVIKTIDKGYAFSIKNQQHELLWHHYNHAFLFDSTLLKKYDLEGKYNDRKYLPDWEIATLEGNEFLIMLNSNAIRRFNQPSFSFVDILKKHFIWKHSFRLDSTSILNDEPVYCISFKYINDYYSDHSVGMRSPKDSMPGRYDAFGRIIIGKKNKAILLFEYTNKDAIKVVIENRKYKNWYYTSYLSFSNYFFLNLPISSMATYKVPSKLIPPSIRTVNQINHNQLIVKFSKPVNYLEAENISNYKIIGFYPKYTTKNPIIKPLKIKYYKEDSSCTLTLENDWQLNTKNDSLEKVNRIELKAENIKDLNGNLLNQPISIKFSQCREFFVNDITDNISFDTLNCINKNLPMHKQKVISGKQESKEKFNYMMTLPLE